MPATARMETDTSRIDKLYRRQLGKHSRRTHLGMRQVWRFLQQRQLRAFGGNTNFENGQLPPKLPPSEPGFQ